MDQHSTPTVPLLSSSSSSSSSAAEEVVYRDDTEETTTSSSSARLLLLLVLRILMWVIFIVWVTLCFFFPTNFVQGVLLQKWITITGGTLFGITGSMFLVFTAPILLITFLAIAYVNLNVKENQKKNTKFSGFRLWTFPIIIDGPFGIVSAAELIGILLFSAYIIWAVSYFTLHNLDYYSKLDDLPSREKIAKVIKLTGLELGTVGLFCLAFLFIPVARGSFLLRLIDIPFEHAVRYHVWLGHLTMLMLTLHGLCFISGWIIEGKLQDVFDWADSGTCVLAGVISLFAGLLMWVTSLPPVRKKNFELFFYTHQLYIVFSVFLALHVGDFVFCITAAGIFLFLLDRFLRFCQSRKTVNVVSATSLPCGTLELILSKPRNLQYNALSFVFLQIRELSWLQWHPFSVSSSPLDGKYHVSVLIKVLGEWTKKLGENISSTRCKITASIEGPYGHESSYHLKYKNLVLVAGGIGISPFLAILRDILHHIAQGTPCLPENIVVIWAVKTSKELSLLSSFNIDSICPFFSDKLNIKIQTYVTQESDPPLEDGKNFKIKNCSDFPIEKNNGISGLVGTGNNIWSGLYVVFSTFGLIFFVALVNIFYVNPSGIPPGWLTGLLFVICMIASVLTFGTFVVVLWYLWERSDASKNYKNDEPKMYSSVTPVTLGDLSTIKYGHRPNFREILCAISDRWGRVDVGVIVCGPESLQCSVAKECRSLNLKGGKSCAFFHFNKHSFDL